ncbi:CHAT domain-containing protein [Streptomyces mayteni]
MTNPDGHDAGLRTWAAVAVRQAQQVWPQARQHPQSAAPRLVIEQLITIERLLSAEDPARAAVVPWLGRLMAAVLRRRSPVDPGELAAALGHLRWTDRARPLNDQLALLSRMDLAALLIPAELPPEAREESAPPELVEPLRERLSEALNALARVIAGDLTTREAVLRLMEHVATLLSALPAPPGQPPPPPPPQEVAAEPPATPATPDGEPAAEALAGAVRELVALARRDPPWCTRLLAWLCVTSTRPRVSPADAERELAQLGLDLPVLAPLSEPLATLRSDARDPGALAARLAAAALAVRDALLALSADAPERIRLAKLHAALLVQADLQLPETADFAAVDPAAMRPEPDEAARAAWWGEADLDWILYASIDNLWVSNGEIERVERSATWLRESIDALPTDGPRAAATRRLLSFYLAHRLGRAGQLDGSLQDGVAAQAIAEELADTTEPNDDLALLGLLSRYDLARRSLDRAARESLMEDLIRTLSDRYEAAPSDPRTRFDITGTLGSAYAERAALTGDPADRRAAARFLCEALATEPATLPAQYEPYFPVERARLMTTLAKVDPRREVVDRAAAEVHGVIEGSRMSRREEAVLRFHLGQAMLRAITHRADLGLLDPGIAELSRVRALVAESHGPLRHDTLRELAAAHWTSAVTGGPNASRDREASMEIRREALELTAADVLRQLGAEHALSAARAATGHVLFLALRCAENRRPAEAVEALELGRALVLKAAAATHGVPRLLADRGHAELAEERRAQTPRHPLQPGTATGETPPGSGLPSSPRRRALAALGTGDGTGARELLGAPDVVALTAALAASGADALVYLVPGEGFRPHIPGCALVLRPGDAEPAVLELPLLLSSGSHHLERYLTATAERTRVATAQDASRASREAAEAEWQAALSELCDWAWPAAIGPVLGSLAPLGRPPRIVLIPCGPLGVVPWHAARQHIVLGGHRYACQDAVFTYASSGAQFQQAAARARLPTTGPRVLVTDPRLSLAWAEIETEALRAACYPDARRYGEFVAAEGVPDAPGGCDDLLAVLPGGGRPAAVMHVSCHGVAGPSPTRSALSLADGELTVARILDHAEAAAPHPEGPLVVLSACETDLSTGDHDEALTLSTALVARGAADVVGSRWAVRDGATALMMVVFHRFLSDRGLGPADALRAAQLWMLDRDRRPPPGLGDPLHAEAGRADLDQVHLWAAFTHQGNPAAAPTR